MYTPQVEAELKRKKCQRMEQRLAEVEFWISQHELDAQVSKLPAPLRARIGRFRDIGGINWRVRHEQQEIDVCLSATAKAKVETGAQMAFSGVEAQIIQALNMEDPDEQLLKVLRIHGAGCVRSGCEEYGCWAFWGESLSHA